jgi:uncharacterized protein
MRTSLLLIGVLLLATLSLAAELPQLSSYVNDYAGLLSPGAARQLEAELAAFEQSDSTQIVVLAVPSLGGWNIEEYSIAVVEKWQPGQKGKDNGVLLLIAKEDRKMRIEVGRGLEGKLTDLVSGRIIRNEIQPPFKAGNFDAGVSAGVHAIMKSVRGEYQAEPARDLRHGRKGANPIFTLLVFVMVAAVFLGGMSRVLGGVAGAVGLPIAAALSFSGISLLLLGLLAVVGFLAGLFLSFVFGSGGGGFGGPFFGGFGGGWGGGGFGGGSGGGGFSGGGGSFGGGGASGDW